MQHIFFQTKEMDNAALVNFNLTEDILMENAAIGLEKRILKQKFFRHHTYDVIIFCGSGNNGGDGWTLARRLHKKLRIAVYEVKPPRSPMCILQSNRAKTLGVPCLLSSLQNITTSVIVDCIFGSGFEGDIDGNPLEIINWVNNQNSFVIACDIPSGINKNGQLAKDNIQKDTVVRADETVAMGAYTLALFSDMAKDYIGKIFRANLGIATSLYENIQSTIFLLEKQDMKLPFRTMQSAHKGNFGHAVIIQGEKHGASIISAMSALKFGAGLVSMYTTETSKKILMNIPSELMLCTKLPKKTTAIALGMGLGRDKNILDTVAQIIDNNPTVSLVIDGDFFYYEHIEHILQTKKNTATSLVLTPHPKEMVALLNRCSYNPQCQTITIKDILNNKEKILREFCMHFPNTVVVLKGANTFIGYCNSKTNETNIFINPLGSPALAKAGSGDVLAGLIVSLLAQKYSALNATITANIAHALSTNSKKNDFSLTPKKIIKNIAKLKNY